MSRAIHPFGRLSGRGEGSGKLYPTKYIDAIMGNPMGLNPEQEDFGPDVTDELKLQWVNARRGNAPGQYLTLPAIPGRNRRKEAWGSGGRGNGLMPSAAPTPMGAPSQPYVDQPPADMGAPMMQPGMEQDAGFLENIPEPFRQF